MGTINLEYIAAGGNRHPSAAAWAPGLLAFGAGNNIALWNPEDERCNGITALLTGHTDVVNAVKIYDAPEKRLIITGSADKTTRIWSQSSGAAPFTQLQCLKEHQGSINTISVLPSAHLFVTGSADGTLTMWHFSEIEATLVQSLPLRPRYLPLTSSLIQIDGGAVMLAVAGTSTSIQLYVRSKADANFELQATLLGHEGWIRSLAFVQASPNDSSNIFLASASQDKYIRLWRFRRDPSIVPSASLIHPADQTLAGTKNSLSNKAQQVGDLDKKHIVTFEALLVGHEDWIYTVQWAPQDAQGSGLTLLSASADNSLAMWRADEMSGVWVCYTRLGDISAQKGSTTATGSAGGFWIGLWQPDGQSVVSLARTGSWRRWNFDHSRDMWLQFPGISGHTQEVQDLAWATDASYFLTTSSDQTTRLFAEWKRNGAHSWHEFARPQIHGYDLNCIDTLSPNRFISGADEKLLRVFNKPKAIARLLTRLCELPEETDGELPDAANIPVLGLSNKAIAADSNGEVHINGTKESHVEGHDGFDSIATVPDSTLDLTYPPLEGHLSRHTLWPEHEKLYGHGYEISAVAASHDGSMVATACKASSLDYAVIRIYECREWREVKPALSAHNLTVTSLAFSLDDQYLLSVGRDRQWAIFERDSDQSNAFKLLTANPKGHSRMILDCSWAPSKTDCIFATAGRDKMVKIWKRASVDNVKCVTDISENSAVTAVDFRITSARDAFRMALGTEDGGIRVLSFNQETLEVASSHYVPASLLPCRAVNALRWRPNYPENDDLSNQLAAASDDTSLRVFNIGP